MDAHPVLGPTCVLKVNINCCKACPLKLRKELKKVYGVTSIAIDTKNGLVKVSGNTNPSTLIETIKKTVKKKAEIWYYDQKDDTNNNYVEKEFDNLFKKMHSAHGNDKDKKNFQNQDCGCLDDDDDSDFDSDDFDDDENSDVSHHHNMHNMKYGHDHGLHGPNGTHTRYHPYDNNVHGINSNIGGRAPAGHYFSAAPPRVYGHFPGPPPPPPPAGPPYGYQGYPPMMYGRPSVLPQPPGYDYYGKMVPPAGALAPTTLPPAYPPYYKRRDPPVGNSVFHYFSDDNSSSCTIM